MFLWSSGFLRIIRCVQLANSPEKGRKAQRNPLFCGEFQQVSRAISREQYMPL
jgi:hypothetical protein